jgi:hypothetical protein
MRIRDGKNSDPGWKKVGIRNTGRKVIFWEAESIQSARLCSMSPELGSPPPPHPQESVAPPSLGTGTRGETHSHPGEGVGGPNADNGRDILVPGTLGIV